MLALKLLAAAALPLGAAAFTAGTPAALYGLNPAASLFRLAANGSFQILAPPLPYEQAQQLSCVDAARGIFYFVGYSAAAARPYLVGLSLADGSTLSETPLPEFYDGQYVGIGQYVAVEPSSARVFVGGQDANKFHIVALVTPGAGDFTVLANLTSSLRDVFGGTSVYVPETDEFWFELDLDIMILDMKTKKISVLPVSASFEILGMNRDPKTGVIYGLGGGPGQGVRTVVALHAANRTIVATGSVPEYGMQMGGMTAYDWTTRSVFWIGQKAGADPSSQWFLVQNAVEGGRTLSASPVCGNAELCPWSLHFA